MVQSARARCERECFGADKKLELISRLKLCIGDANVFRRCNRLGVNFVRLEKNKKKKDFMRRKITRYVGGGC